MTARALADRWSETWRRASRPAPPGLIEELLAAYERPPRAYHTTQHLAECFALLDGCGVQPEQPVVVELALWFHDAIYDPRAGDNEARSARWAIEALASLPAAEPERIAEMIRGTAGHADPRSPDEALLFDVDLSILGAATDRFAEYEQQIRREYAHVAEPAYRTGRRAVLGRFLSLDRIYRTTPIHDALEARARANLAGAIDELGG